MSMVDTGSPGPSRIRSCQAITPAGELENAPLRPGQPEAARTGFSGLCACDNELTSTIHVAQGAGMSPIIMLDELVTPTAVFVGITRSKRSRNCLIMPSDKFDFGVFGRGKLLNEKNELLLAHLRATRTSRRI